MPLFKKKKIPRDEVIAFGVDGMENLKEAYIRLKDNILYYGIDGQKKVIQIESSVAREAKTSILVNLGIALGDSGKKVCIVDLDTRRPRVHRAFGIVNINGISDYMLDEKMTKESLYKETKYKNVTVINRGSEVENASYILTSEKIKNLFQELRKDFDFILVDCPPVLIISDYIHISKLSDGVLFVYSFGKTKKKQASEAIKLLKANHIDLIGAVMSFYDSKKSDNASEYKYGSYGYGEEYYHHNNH